MRTDSGSLFEPSLNAGRDVRPAYSVRSHYVVAFLGGLLAILIFGAVSARQLGRLKRDWWIFALIAGLALLQLALIASEGESLTPEKMRHARLVIRIIAVSWVGVLYLRHRSLHRAIDLAGIERPSPWKLGIASILGSFVLTFVIVGLMQMGWSGAR